MSSHYMPLDRFKSEVDDYIRQVRQLAPINQPVGGGSRRRHGGETRTRSGVKRALPVGPEHAKALQELGQELGVDIPF